MTTPSIPGLPDNQQPHKPVTPSTTGLPALPGYQDMPTGGDYGTTATPGTPEWYQQELGGLYGQKILIGITTTPATGNGPGGGGKPYTPSETSTPARTNDKFKTSEQIYKQFVALANGNPAQFAQYQAMLYDGGFYGATPRASVHWGMLTDQDTGALKSAISAYLTSTHPGGTGDSPVTWVSTDPTKPGFLDSRALIGRQNQAQGGVGGAGGTGTTAPQVQLTDPTALKAYAQQAAQQSLDRALTPDELTKFVDAFHSQQTASQTSQAGSVTTPDASADAMAFAEQQAPDEFRQHNVSAYSNELLNLFLPTGSQLASFTPTASVK